MGAAKRRGTFEERKAAAIKREERLQNARQMLQETRLIQVVPALPFGMPMALPDLQQPYQRRKW